MGALFGGGAPRSAGPPPELPAPKVMPDPDRDAQEREAFRKLSEKRGRATTRANTIIGDSDTLG